MGLLDFFKKNPPGQCFSCKEKVAELRCPICSVEYCSQCIKSWAEKTKSEPARAGPKISVTTAGVVDRTTSSAISDRVSAQMKAIRDMAEKGKGICLSCTIEKGKPIALKAI